LKLPFSLFLALRYLKPKRTFLSIITLISVLGVMLGVTVLILVISVMTGFDRELRQKVIDFDAHILVTGEEVLGSGAAAERDSGPIFRDYFAIESADLRPRASSRSQKRRR